MDDRASAEKTGTGWKDFKLFGLCEMGVGAGLTRQIRGPSADPESRHIMWVTTHAVGEIDKFDLHVVVGEAEPGMVSSFARLVRARAMRLHELQLRLCFPGTAAVLPCPALPCPLSLSRSSLVVSLQPHCLIVS